MSEKVQKPKEFLELTPEEIQQIERQKKITLRSSYMMDFTKKKIDKSHGFGKINAFVDGDRLNPKLIQTGNDPNSLYIKKNQAILSKSKTGVTTYQWDFCGLKLKNKGRSRSMLWELKNVEHNCIKLLLLNIFLWFMVSIIIKLNLSKLILN